MNQKVFLENKLIAGGIVLLTAALILVAALLKPIHNWDTIGYVAAAYQDNGHTGADLLARSYADVRADSGEADYRVLTEGIYRATVASDPVSLEQQIPFYSIRMVYVGLVRLVGEVTGSFARSSHLISAFFGFASVLAMGLIFWRERIPAVALPLVVLPAGVLNISRLATPDTLACFTSLLLVICMSANHAVAYALVATLPLMRSDFVIFSLLAAIYMFCVHKRTYAGLAAAVSVLLYLLIGKVNGNLGYFTLLHFTFLDLNPYPADLVASHDPRDYLVPFLVNTNYLVSDGIFVLFAMALVIIAANIRTVTQDRRIALFIVLPTAFALGHFVLFPHYDNRFLVSSFLLVIAGILRGVHAEDPLRTSRA